ncbi:MAG: hypothetical protein EOP48_09030 [Sphingobacteriales bacterium]|nr:MAG: hypothetical protein EOP48_09030 [Sphingobacteriales bacterium]
MKTKMKLPAILLGLLLLLTGTTQHVMAQNDEVSLQSFYDELSPYGQWIKDPQYGYVWRPDVDQEEFRPYYTNGRWAMTEYGNTWVSNYDWGWAPFHYGRWVYNRYNNWVWIPDTVWGPAWVSWRSGGGYYGWAPLGPSISIGINIGRGGYRIPDMCWNFIPYNNIYYNSYPRYYGNRNRIYIQNTVIINNTYVRNNRTYYTGPRAEDIRRATNQRVTVYNVNRDSRPGASRIDNNSVNIYTPRPGRGSANTNSAPRDAVQGSINRGVVSRDNTMSASRGERGNNSVNSPSRGMDNRGGDRNPTMNTNPSREGNGINSSSRGIDNRGGERNATMNTNPSREGNGGMQPSRGMENRSGEVNTRSEAQRGERGTEQRVERRDIPQQTMPQRMERSQSQQERGERVQAPQQQMPQRMESKPQPQQQAPQQRAERAERSQPQAQPQRVERTQSAPPQRGNSGGGESRGSRGGESSGGGRVRGGK